MSGTDNSAKPPRLFDRARLARRLNARRDATPDFITELVVADLLDRLLPIKKAFATAAIMGPDARVLPQTALSADATIHFTRFSTLREDGEFARLDPESLRLPRNDHDLLVSLLDLQTVNDVPGFLTQLHRHMAPDGLLVVAAIGGRSLSELRAAWLEADIARHGGAIVRVAPFMDVRDGGSLLQRAGLALPVADVETHKVRYSSPLALMREIKALGAANPMAEQPPFLATPRQLAKALESYPADADGRFSATLEIVWLSGWAPHESQQKPLAPGSAQMSLGCVLPDKSGA